MKYRNRISEPGTTISGFADNKKKKKLIPTDRPKIFLTCESKHTYFFFDLTFNSLLIADFRFFVVLVKSGLIS
jgi:hypothetical protein